MARPAILGSYFLCLSILAPLTNCRSQKATQGPDEQTILMLLEENFSPDDLAFLESEQVVSAKRTSRSQNLWLLKVLLLDQRLEQFLIELNSANGVVDAYQADSDESVNFNNSNKKESSPND